MPEQEKKKEALEAGVSEIEWRVHCTRCGKSVSPVVKWDGEGFPKDGHLLVRAWVECPECIEEVSKSSMILDKDDMQAIVDFVMSADYINNEKHERFLNLAREMRHVLGM